MYGPYLRGRRLYVRGPYLGTTTIYHGIMTVYTRYYAVTVTA